MKLLLGHKEKKEQEKLAAGRTRVEAAKNLNVGGRERKSIV